MEHGLTGATLVIALGVIMTALSGCSGDGAPTTTYEAIGRPIRFERLATMGSADGPGALGTPAGAGEAIAMDSRGNYWIASEEAAWSISMFDSTGTWLKTVGRAGEGPGEFASISALVVGKGDTLQAFDIRNGRHVWIDPDGQVVRSRPRSGGVESVEAASDGLVLLAGGGSRGARGQPVHVLDMEGEVLFSLGGGPNGMEYDFYGFSRYVAWAGTTGVVWMTPALDYHLERWTVEGELLERWERDPEWMPPDQPWVPATGDHPVSPTMRDLQFDSEGRLWTLAIVGEPNWVEGLGQPTGDPEAPGRRMWPIEDVDAVLGSRIEVLDVESRQVLASAFFPTLFVAFLGPGILASYSDHENGVPQITVWRATLGT